MIDQKTKKTFISSVKSYFKQTNEMYASGLRDMEVLKQSYFTERMKEIVEIDDKIIQDCDQVIRDMKIISRQGEIFFRNISKIDSSDLSDTNYRILCVEVLSITSHRRDVEEFCDELFLRLQDIDKEVSKIIKEISKEVKSEFETDYFDDEYDIGDEYSNIPF